MKNRLNPGAVEIAREHLKILDNNRLIWRDDGKLMHSGEPDAPINGTKGCGCRGVLVEQWKLDKATGEEYLVRFYRHKTLNNLECPFVKRDERLWLVGAVLEWLLYTNTVRFSKTRVQQGYKEVSDDEIKELGWTKKQLIVLGKECTYYDIPRDQARSIIKEFFIKYRELFDSNLGEDWREEIEEAYDEVVVDLQEKHPELYAQIKNAKEAFFNKTLKEFEALNNEVVADRDLHEVLKKACEQVLLQAGLTGSQFNARSASYQKNLIVEQLRKESELDYKW